MFPGSSKQRGKQCSQGTLESRRACHLVTARARACLIKPAIISSRTLGAKTAV